VCTQQEIPYNNLIHAICIKNKVKYNVQKQFDMVWWRKFKVVYLAFGPISYHLIEILSS